jgi:phospholipase/carboxylesterase
MRARSIGLVAGLLLLACDPPYAGSAGDRTASPPQADAQAIPPVQPQRADAVDEGQSAGELRYVERVLGGADPNAALPMVVAIHGLGDDPENFAHVFDQFTEPVRVILPRGIDRTEGGGWSWFPLRARDADVDALARGIRDSADKLAVAIGELQKTRKTRGKPIVTGFSQGGMLSFALAVLHPDVVGVALPVGGWLPPPLWPQQKLAAAPIVAFHGTEDGAVAYAATKDAVDHLAKLGLAAELRTYEGVGHVITPEIQRDWFDRVADAARGAGKN